MYLVLSLYGLKQSANITNVIGCILSSIKDILVEVHSNPTSKKAVVFRFGLDNDLCNLADVLPLVK